MGSPTLRALALTAALAACSTTTGPTDLVDDDTGLAPADVALVDKSGPAEDDAGPPPDDTAPLPEDTPPVALDAPAPIDTPPPLDVPLAMDAPRPIDVPAPRDVPVVRDVPVARDTGPDIRNPVINRPFADPFVLRVGARYHAFATAGTVNGDRRNIQHAVSADLADWTLDRDALPALPGWIDRTEPNTWAPGVAAISATRYVLYYSAHLAGTPGQMCIGRAVSDTPAGPYADTFGGPFICDREGATRPWAIDPYPFRGPGGNLWLLWRQDIGGGVNTLVIRRLADNGTSFAAGSTMVTLLRRNDSAWEAPIIENPAMVYGPGDRYSLFYSGNAWRTAQYAVGWAVCEGPTGPCTRRSVNQAWFRSRGAFAGPGGEAFFTDTEGDSWMAWHAWDEDRVGPDRGGTRSLWVGRFRFAGGEPEVTPAPVRAGF